MTRNPETLITEYGFSKYIQVFYFSLIISPKVALAKNISFSNTLVPVTTFLTEWTCNRNVLDEQNGEIGLNIYWLHVLSNSTKTKSVLLL